MDNKYHMTRITRNILAYGHDKAFFTELNQFDTLLIEHNLILHYDGTSFYQHDNSYVFTYGIAMDEHSALTEGAVVTFDSTKMELTIMLAEDLPVQKTDPSILKLFPEVSHDFMGVALPKNGNAIPGAFQNLKKGKNVYNLKIAQGTGPSTLAGTQMNVTIPRSMQNKVVIGLGRSFNVPQGGNVNRAKVYDIHGQLLAQFSISKGQTTLDISKLNGMASRVSLVRWEK